MFRTNTEREESAREWCHPMRNGYWVLRAGGCACVARNSYF